MRLETLSKHFFSHFHTDHRPVTSILFAFLIDSQIFFVYADHSPEQHSEPLKALITVNIKEKNQGYVELPGTSATTFGRFLG